MNKGDEMDNELYNMKFQYRELPRKMVKKGKTYVEADLVTQKEALEKLLREHGHFRFIAKNVLLPNNIEKYMALGWIVFSETEWKAPPQYGGLHVVAVPVSKEAWDKACEIRAARAKMAKRKATRTVDNRHNIHSRTTITTEKVQV